jgi:SAM-dependent methyltransferase
MKDNFSHNAAGYAAYRPVYPQALFNFLYQYTPGFNHALDVATGNGQVAAQLATRFKQVTATDISNNQMQQAPQMPNLHYLNMPAETLSFPPASFDLVTVAQAIHWFNLDDFYTRALAALKPGGLLAAIGYGLIRINEIIDPLIDEFYTQTVGPFWDKERQHLDDGYANIRFPLPLLPAPVLFIAHEWPLDHLLGYLDTWSAVKHYTTYHGKSPINGAFITALHQRWPVGQKLTVQFALFVKAGIKP